MGGFGLRSDERILRTADVGVVTRRSARASIIVTLYIIVTLIVGRF